MIIKPALMSAPMVRAILREIEAPGTGKTQTRRPALITRKRTGQSPTAIPTEWRKLHDAWAAGERDVRIWVRETALYWINSAGNRPSHVAAFQADGYELQPGENWRPSIHMPRRFSRITLEVTDVRLRRLQDISQEDARAEGALLWAESLDWRDWPPLDAFVELWDDIHGRGAWAANPEVVVISFRPHLRNIDQFRKERNG